MSGIDVRDLAKEKLSPGKFPASPRSDFRLFLAPEVHTGTWEHAKQDTEIEICGVLVGRWEQDEHGPFAVATDFIRCDKASSKFAEVTFTHESWSDINREMDTRFADARIIGWYHSHPDFGIFLSERDCFIHQHFFSGPGQIAYVIDPVREHEGVFAWHNDKPELLEHFWVGDSIRIPNIGREDTDGGSRQPSSAAEGAHLGERPLNGASFNSTTWLLLGLTLFLLGYFLSGLRTRWERNMMLEGAVAHYGVNKLMKVGLEKHLAAVRHDLAVMTEAVDKMPLLTESSTEEEVERASKQRTLVVNNLQILEKYLGQLQQLYGLSSTEIESYRDLVIQKQVDLMPQPPVVIKPGSAATGPTPGLSDSTSNEPIENEPAEPSGQPAEPSTSNESAAP